MRNLIVGIGMFFVVTACADGRREPMTRTGEVREAIQGGTQDSSGAFRAVVSLADIGDPSPQDCSGVLITPRWIMTARHCINGDDLSVNGNIRVFFAFDPAALGAPFVDHTFAVSGSVIMRSPDPSVDEADDEDIAMDVALFRLDERVPAGVASPIFPSLTPNACPGGDFTGTLVGYGPDNEPTLDPPGLCGDLSSDAIRRFSASSGWERSDEDTGSVYRNHWTIATNPCVYNGVVGGDSGGALIGPSGQLCAINPGASRGSLSVRLARGRHQIDDPNTLIA